jgi:hypothetical protein
VDRFVVGFFSQEKDAFLDGGVRQELILAVLAENQVGLLKKLFLHFHILFFPPANPCQTFFQAGGGLRARLVPKKIFFLVGEDADGYATSLLSRVDRCIAKVAFAGVHFTPRDRFIFPATVTTTLY